MGHDYDGKINYWDMRYYMTMVEEKNYAVEQNKLKEYFPLHVVTKGKFGIFFSVFKFLSWTALVDIAPALQLLMFFTLKTLCSHS